MSEETVVNPGDESAKPVQELKTPPGKVFAESINIYDDQARVAFEYYRKAAQKIIAEEDRIDNLRKESDERLAELKKGKTSAFIGCAISALATVGVLIWSFQTVVYLTVLPAVALLVFVVKMLGASKKIAAEQETRDGLDREYNSIRKDYRISKLGVAYVPVATSVPFENRSFVLDDTETVGNTEFSLYQMNAQEEFLSTLQEIRQSKDSLPMVESGDAAEDVQTSQMSPSIESVRLHDFVGTLDRDLRSASYFLNDLNKTSVSLPVIDPQSDYSAFLRDHCAEEVGRFPVLNVFTQRAYAEELTRFDELNQMRKRMAADNAKLEKMLQEFIVDVSAYVQLLSRAKLTSSNKIVDYSNGLLLNAFKASYNHYSALLESEEIKRIQEDNFDYKAGEGTYTPFHLSPASRVLFDPISGNWVSDDGARTSFPFGIHQIQEEIIAPLVQNLLKETRTERLKIYTNIMDQKRDYLNQWHRDTEDFYGRGRAEHNNTSTQMQPVLGAFNAAVSQYKSYEDTERSMRHAPSSDLDSIDIKASSSGQMFSIAYCEEQAKQIEQLRTEYNDYIERLKDDIDRRATDFGYTKFYDAYLRDGHAKEVAMSLLAVDHLDERQRMLLRANAYIASNAALPPSPEVDDSVYKVLGTDLNEISRQTIDDLEANRFVDPGAGDGDGADDGSGGGGGAGSDAPAADADPASQNDEGVANGEL